MSSNAFPRCEREYNEREEKTEIAREERMKYYDDYDTEPIGHGNPYHRCKGCGRSVPEINGRLEGHLSDCPYLQKIKAQEEQDWLKFLIQSVVDSLPQNRDWLDPDIEKAMREVITPASPGKEG